LAVRSALPQRTGDRSRLLLYLLIAVLLAIAVVIALIIVGFALRHEPLLSRGATNRSSLGVAQADAFNAAE
jgi:hypothetical protein